MKLQVSSLYYELYVEPIEISFSVVIESGVNLPPYFKDPLVDYFPIQIEKTHEPSSWEFYLPDAEDIDSENVEVEVNLANANGFMSYN